MKLLKKSFVIILAITLLILPVKALDYTQIKDDSFVEALSLADSLDYSEEINKAFNGVIDQQVSEEVLGRVSALSTNPDPDKEVFCTVTYLGSIPETTSRGLSNRNVYSVTAVEKTTSNTSEEDGMFAWISMTWIDNFGLDNEIVRVQGGWGTGAYSVLSRQVWFGVKSVLPDSTFDGDLYEVRYPTTDSFNYVPSKKLVGGILRAYSFCDLDGHTSLCVDVTPTIFD